MVARTCSAISVSIATMRTLCMKLASAMSLFRLTCVRNKAIVGACALRFYPQAAAKLAPPPFLDLAPSRRFTRRFCEQRIPKELGAADHLPGSSIKTNGNCATRPFVQYRIGKCWPSCHLTYTSAGLIKVLMGSACPRAEERAMLRNRFLILTGGCFLAASAAWADNVGFIDCRDHPDPTQVFAKARQSHEVVASVACGERFTVLQYGFIFSRIQTKDGQVGYVYSSVISADRSGAAVPAPATTSTRATPATSTVPAATATVAQPNSAAP